MGATLKRAASGGQQLVGDEPLVSENDFNSGQSFRKNVS